MVVALALFLLQQEAPSFGKDQRVTAAVYHFGSDPRHAAELLEMGKAGVEIALIPFAGPAEILVPLVAALDGLEKEGKKFPRLAPLVQPGSVPDLSPVDAFQARLPRRYWAQIDGRPVVW